MTQSKLNLSNSGKLELFFIGIGSAFAATMNQTNFLIIKGDTHIMVDFGMTGPRALFQTAGLGILDIEVIFPTHSHADHIGGLECLALLNRYAGQKIFGQPKKTNVIITEEYQRVLWDATLRGGLEKNEESGGRNLNFGDYFNAIRPKWKTHQPREIFEISIGSINLEIFRTKHIPDSAPSWETSFISYGLLVDGRVFISGDTRFDPELIEMYAPRAEIMFHDVQFFSEGVHAPLDKLKTLSAKIKEKMILIHYADNWNQQEINDFSGWARQGKSYIFP